MLSFLNVVTTGIFSDFKKKDKLADKVDIVQWCELLRSDFLKISELPSHCQKKVNLTELVNKLHIISVPCIVLRYQFLVSFFLKLQVCKLGLLVTLDLCLLIIGLCVSCFLSFTHLFIF